MESRKNSYDLLRVISTIAVITVHISGFYATAATSSNWFGERYTNNILVTCIYRCLSSFAVPVFIMLSGALALDNTKNRNYKYYYRKEFRNIGVVTFIVSILYFVYGVLRVVITGLVNSKPVFEILRGGGRTSNRVFHRKAFLSSLVPLYDDWDFHIGAYYYQI